MSDLEKWLSISEAQLQSTVVEILEWQGWLTYHTHDSRRSDPGFPDLVAVKGNRLMFLEFKSQKGKISDEQIEWLSRLSQAHGEVYLVRPSSMDAFLKAAGGDYEGGLETHWNNVREGE